MQSWFWSHRPRNVFNIKFILFLIIFHVSWLIKVIKCSITWPIDLLYWVQLGSCLRKHVRSDSTTSIIYSSNFLVFNCRLIFLFSLCFLLLYIIQALRCIINKVIRTFFWHSVWMQFKLIILTSWATTAIPVSLTINILEIIWPVLLKVLIISQYKSVLSEQTRGCSCLWSGRMSSH